MSWTYSGDPSDSELDECRFILSDTDENNPIMTDEEIEYLISLYGNNKNILMYQLFSMAATKFARDIKMSLGPQSEDPTSRLNFFKEQAAAYKRKESSAGLPIVKYAYPKVFRKGMQSNPVWPKRGDYLV